MPLRANSGGVRYLFADLLGQLLVLESTHRYVIFVHPAGEAVVREAVARAPAQPPGRIALIAVLDEEQIYPHRDAFDLYFCPFNSLKPRVFDRPTVAVLHDIQEQYFPEYFSYAELLARREVYPEICRAATLVVTVSQFSRRCLMEKFGVAGEKVHVVYNAPQQEIVEGGEEDLGEWGRAPLPARFLFYPANNYPHKNHALLLDALSQASGEDPLPALVFSGGQMIGGYPLAEQIAHRRLQDRCFLFEELTGREMRFLYRHAVACVMPTMFEGFGMPAVEALACGCPLLCSDIAPLRELAGEAATYFAPGDVADFRRQLRRVMADPALRREQALAGRAAAARFSWQATAREMLRLFALAREAFVRPAGDAPPPRIALLPGGCPPAALLQAAREQALDLVGEILPGNQLRPTALQSLAACFDPQDSAAVYLGEAAVFAGSRYHSVSRLVFTGDEMWKLEGLLFPEMLFLRAAVLEHWTSGRQIVEAGGSNWRWELLLAAKRAGRLRVVRRTLADCRRPRLWPLALLHALSAGMLDFYRMDNQPVRVPLLRRFERRARVLCRFLPAPLQHAGTRLWYRLTR